MGSWRNVLDTSETLALAQMHASTPSGASLLELKAPLRPGACCTESCRGEEWCHQLEDMSVLSTMGMRSTSTLSAAERVAQDHDLHFRP